LFFDELIQEDVSFNGYNIDLGCANGRNFKIFLQFNIKLIGIDNSIEFLKISRNRIATIDNIFSIAAIHHIKNIHNRNHVLKQIYAILNNNGLLFLTLWRKYQKKYRYYFIRDWFKRLYSSHYRVTQNKLDLEEFGDKFIPWTISKENLTYNRFYHFFSRKELKKLLESFVIKEMKKRGGPNKKDNFFVLARKEREGKKTKTI